MIVTFPVPEVQILHDDVALSLDSNVTVLLTTTTTIDRLIAALHDARQIVVQQEQTRSERAERMVARAVNKLRRQSNAEPAGTVSTATSITQHIVFADGARCPCSCSAVCGCETTGDVA